VIAGHVDSATAPGVFYHLRDVVPGDRVIVGHADGSVSTFSVQAVIEVPKARFPSDEVYGPVPFAGLRLVTCGGVFDRASGHYLDNIIVFARATIRGSEPAWVEGDGWSGVVSPRSRNPDPVPFSATIGLPGVSF